MKRMGAGLVAIASFAVLTLTGCATHEEWNTWRSHDTHFASGQHAGFSMRNRGDTAERVKPTDPANAQDEGWWGRELSMAPGQASMK